MLLIPLHKVPLNINNVGYNVKDVQQNRVPHQGQAEFEVSRNGIKTAIRVVASSNIRDNMLNSYQDLLKFQIIPINFPYKVFTYTLSIDVLESIKHDFSDALNDRLNPTPMKTDKPMQISLKENAKPLRVLAPRGVPREYEEPAKASIKDLMDKGALKRVSEVTDWCSPGFFVAKSDGRVKLVTDFTHLNQYVNRPVHPFPSAWNMQGEFQQVKLLLTTPTTVQPFNPSLDSILMTDASRLYSIGFALLQSLPNDKWSLIQCGSASLTPTQTRYATMELECMAIQRAILKCSYYLRGLPTFEVWTDH